MTARAAFTELAISRAIRAAQKAGARVVVYPDRIEVVTDCQVTIAPTESQRQDEPRNSWEDV